MSSPKCSSCVTVLRPCTLSISSAVQLHAPAVVWPVFPCLSVLGPKLCHQRRTSMSVETRRRFGVEDGLNDRAATNAFTPESTRPIATLSGRPLISNRGIPLSLDWVKQVRINTSAVERRTQTHVARRTVKKDWQAAWMLRAISCMDLTTLSGDDTEERVRRLCAKARHPIQEDLVKRLRIEELEIKVAAVCVYHTFVETAVRALEGSGVRVAAVSTGFPTGLSPLTERVAEIRRSVEAGANEIDVVITRAHVFGGKWQALYDEIAAFKQASGSAHMKVILGAGDLLTL